MTKLFTFVGISAAIFFAGKCDDCHLPPNSGSCSDSSTAKEELRYYYSAKNLKCAEMPYTGCGGNSNNFKTLSECNAKCGKRLVDTTMVKAILAAEKKSLCWFNNRTYKVGEEVPEVTTEDRCKFCSCVDMSEELNRSALITCESGECFNSPGPGCFKIHEPKKCCPDRYCPANDEPFKCLYNGVGYFEGQSIYSEDYPCMECHCNKNWNGILTTDGGICREINCLLAVSEHFLNKDNCEPRYFSTEGGRQSCCGFDWKCD